MKKKLVIIGLIALLTSAMTLGVFASTNSVKVKTTETASLEKEASEEEDAAIINTDVAITTEAAKQVALDSVPGGTFVAMALEDENGTIVYGVDITLQAKEYDVKVDATTGLLLTSDEDHEDADDESEDASDDLDDDQTEHENDQEDEEGHED